MEAQCVITGVLLVTDGGDVAYNGDLFKMGDMFICNCNEASAHTPEENFAGNIPLRWVNPSPSAWERKGVWVWPIKDTLMSAAANAYMRGTP